MNSKSRERVRVIFADQLNQARGKYIPLESVNRNGDTTITICRSLYGVSYDLDLLPVTGAKVLEGISDMEMKFNHDDLRSGWEDHTQIVIPKLVDMDGTALPLDSRQALMAAIDQWRAIGLEPYVGIELEANVFERGENNDWRLLASPSAHAYSTGPIIDPAKVADTLWEAACRINLSLDAINGEYDRGCFELTLKYDKALPGIDDIFLFKQMAREVMYERGYWLSFMPKPSEEAGGCGMHVNFSLFDKEGDNAFNDKENPRQMSKLIKGCLAGWMRYHRPSTALLAPLVNSYQRLKPAMMSGYWTNWAIDHRGVTARVAHEYGKRRRIEHRTADCAANPYLATATLLHTALLGYQNALTLQDAETGDCLESQQSTQHVPDDLPQAIEELSGCKELRAALGDMLIDNFIDMKKDEWERVGKLDTPEEKVGFYFPFI